MRILDEKRVKARKTHKCSWCNSTIEKGEEYQRSTATSDGDIYDWLECDKCKKHVGEMYKELNSYGDVFTQEDFREFIKEKYGKTIQELLKEEV